MGNCIQYAQRVCLSASSWAKRKKNRRKLQKMFAKAMDNCILYAQRVRLSAQSWAKRKKNRRRCTLHLLWHSETTVASAIFRSLREYENIKQIERVEDKWKELQHTYICCDSKACTIFKFCFPWYLIIFTIISFPPPPRWCQKDFPFPQAFHTFHISQLFIWENFWHGRMWGA